MDTISALPARMEYRVWAPVKTFMEEADAYHVVAQFRFLQEALDFTSYAKARMIDEPVVLTGPYGMASVYGPERTSI